MQHVSMININAGCPVKKVTSSGSGSALMRTPSLLADLVKATRSNTDKPVSVKFRSGWDSDSVNVLECAKISEDNGADFVIVHPRTKAMGFSGLSNWDDIKATKQHVSIPVVGNGDVKSLDDAKRMVSQTGCDAVMVGRASLGNPWVFNGEEKKADAKLKEVMLEHIELAREFYGEKAVGLMRKHLLYYVKGLDGRGV